MTRLNWRVRGKSVILKHSVATLGRPSRCAVASRTASSSASTSMPVKDTFGLLRAAARSTRPVPAPTSRTLPAGVSD